MKIPLARPWITQGDKQAVMDVLDSGYLTYGPKTFELEGVLSKFYNNTAVAVSSCSAALTLAVARIVSEASVLEPEIITTPLTYIATALSIIEGGAKPVFADVDPSTLNIDPIEIEKKITSSTVAILPVHFAGLSCNMTDIMQIAREHNLDVIEDCAQAVASYHHGVLAGTFGRFGCLSFYPTKQIGSGDAGCVLCNREDDVKWMRMALHHGSNKKVPHDGPTDVFFRGWKANCNDIDAALILSQFDRLSANITNRQAIADYYDSSLNKRYIRQPAAGNSRYVYPVLTKNRDELKARLKEDGVSTAIHYEPIVTETTYFKNEFGTGRETCPTASFVASKILSLPVFAGMTRDEMVYVVERVNS